MQQDSAKLQHQTLPRPSLGFFSLLTKELYFLDHHGPHKAPLMRNIFESDHDPEADHKYKDCCGEKGLRAHLIVTFPVIST